jgi:hypothetical protein
MSAVYTVTENQETLLREVLTDSGQTVEESVEQNDTEKNRREIVR